MVAVIPSGACAYLTGGSGGTSHSWAVACWAVQINPHRVRRRGVQNLFERSKFNLIRLTNVRTVTLTVTKLSWKCQTTIKLRKRVAFQGLWLRLMLARTFFEMSLAVRGCVDSRTINSGCITTVSGFGIAFEFRMRSAMRAASSPIFRLC